LGPIDEIAGLIASFVGIVTMIRYDLPFRLPPLPTLMRALTETDATEQDRRNLIGFGGLLLFGVGTMLQIFAVLMR
jgi:hypothetical protein